MSEMVTVQISAETFNAIKNIAHELKTQNNRCTAKPYFQVIKTKKWRVAHDEYSHGETKTVRVDTEGDPREFETKEEFHEWLEDISPDYPTQKEVDKAWENMPEYTMEAYYDEENAFLTDKGFEEHVRQNGHNLGKHGKEYHSYLKHAFRNPEMQALFNLIEEVGKN